MSVMTPIKFGQLLSETCNVLPSDLTNSAGRVLTGPDEHGNVTVTFATSAQL